MFPVTCNTGRAPDITGLKALCSSGAYVSKVCFLSWGRKFGVPYVLERNKNRVVSGAKSSDGQSFTLGENEIYDLACWDS